MVRRTSGRIVPLTTSVRKVFFQRASKVSVWSATESANHYSVFYIRFPLIQPTDVFKGASEKSGADPGAGARKGRTPPPLFLAWLCPI